MLLLFTAPWLSLTAEAQTSSTIRFERGKSSDVVSGSISGRDFRDYTVQAAAGQKLKVTLRTSSSATYFNVLPPGSRDEAIFIGSTEGNAFGGTLSVSGSYTIRVYQMASAGRRGESSRFTLNVSVTGGASGGGSGSGRPDGNMGSIRGIQGMEAVRAIDELHLRGFENVDAFSSGNTLYGIYYYRPRRLCVQTTADSSTLLDIRNIRTHPKCR